MADKDSNEMDLTQADAVGNAENPAEAVDWLLRGPFRSGTGGCTVVLWQEQWWEFFGGRWVQRSDTWLRRRVIQELLEAMVWVEGQKSRWQEKYPVDSKRIDSVVEVLGARCVKGFKQLPALMDGGEANRGLIAFEDVLVDPKTGATTERTDRWFDPVVVPCRWDPEAKCEEWERVVEQWSQGKPEWKELLQRWMGYVLQARREEAKWLLMYGRSRAGKGVIARIIQELVGREAFMGVSLEHMAGQFGMQGFTHTRVLSISEGGQMSESANLKVVGVLKRILGGDGFAVDVKYKEPLMNVVVPAAPMLQSNEIPKLVDVGGAVSNKMLMLPFRWSAMELPDGPDLRLFDRLREELPGIARWAVEGAKGVGTPWPVVDNEGEELSEFRLENSPFDFFLESRFQANPEGFVANSILWKEWEAWRKKMGVPQRTSQAFIAKSVRDGTTWPLKGTRMRCGGVQTRGLSGLSLRVDPEDGV